MRILLLTDNFPFDQEGITGGVEARCYYLVKHLSSKNQTFKIIARSGGQTGWRAATWQTVPDRLLFALTSFIKALFTPFDIIEGTNFANYPIAALVGILRFKPIVFWYPDTFVNSWFTNFGKVGILGEMMERFTFKIPNISYIAISETTKQKLIKNGVPPQKIKVIYCGVDNQEIASIKSSSNKCDVCLVSRLVSYKRIDLLIKATPEIAKIRPNFSAVIIGQGPSKQNLIELTNKLEVSDHIVFADYLSSHKAVLEIIASSKILCHPSEAEGFGIVVMEAMALGKPVVINNISVFHEITQDKGCVFFSKGNIESLSDSILNLLDNSKLYNQKSKEALLVAAKFSWDKIAQETLVLYQSLI